jgi:hypothetical protein
MTQNKDNSIKPVAVTFEPALRQIGTVDCPICKTRSAVFLTKTNRPFLSCGFCSVRIFFNGRESIRLLKKKMEPLEDSEGKPKFLFI